MECEAHGACECGSCEAMIDCCNPSAECTCDDAVSLEVPME